MDFKALGILFHYPTHIANCQLYTAVLITEYTMREMNQPPVNLGVLMGATFRPAVTKRSP